MPLRPVSELGLVEVTDLESRANRDTPTRGSSPPETSSSTPDRRAARAPKKPASAGASRRKDATRPTRPSSKAASARASTSRSSKRSVSESKPAGQAAKNGSSSAGNLRKAERGNGSEQRDTQIALRDRSSGAQTKRSAFVDTGFSLLGGAIGVAGGILLCRSVLQR